MNDNPFVKIEDAICITSEKGVTKCAQMFEYEGLLYILAKGGYVRLAIDGRTSLAQGLRGTFRWEKICGIAYRKAAVFGGLERDTLKDAKS